MTPNQFKVVVLRLKSGETLIGIDLLSEDTPSTFTIDNPILVQQNHVIGQDGIQKEILTTSFFFSKFSVGTSVTIPKSEVLILPVEVSEEFLKFYTLESIRLTQLETQQLAQINQRFKTLEDAYIGILTGKNTNSTSVEVDESGVKEDTRVLH